MFVKVFQRQSNRYPKIRNSVSAWEILYLFLDLKFVLSDEEDIRFYAEDWCSKVKEGVG